MKSSKKLTNYLGSFFILFGIFSILVAAYLKEYSRILWFCYIGIILVGIGIIKRNSYLIASQINILLFIMFFWVLDFFSILLTGNILTGAAKYFFDPKFPFLSKIISFQHFIVVPISFYILWLLKLKRKDAWKFSFIQLVLIFIATRIFTLPEQNINCVYKSCMNITIPLIPHITTWFISTFLMVIITNFLLIKLFYKK